MDKRSPFGGSVSVGENISGTISGCREDATWNRTTSDLGEKIGPTCCFIAAESWPAGEPPFCGAPALPGSPYCASHASLCAAAARSPKGARIALAQDLAARAEPPPELGHLAVCVVPEEREGQEGLERWDMPGAAGFADDEA